MSNTLILKRYILTEDPDVIFKKDEHIYVKGEVLMRKALDNKYIYYDFKDFTLFVIREVIFGMTYQHIAKVKLIDEKYKKGINIIVDEVAFMHESHLIIGYANAENKMKNHFIEIKKG